jgi:polar amino acid transport system substrate-binding protein
VNHGALRRLVTTATVVLTAGLALAACGGSNESNTTSSAQPGAPQVKLVQPGKLKTCTSLPYNPFQFDDGGKTVGFDVDMIDLVAKKIGVPQEILDVKFDVIKSGAALNAGNCDIAAAAMTITDERKQNLDFTTPYFDEVIALMVGKGSGVKSLDDVKSKNLKLGVQAGTTSLDYANANGFQPTQFDDAGKQLLAIQSGQVDVVLQDLPVVNDWLKKSDLSSKFELASAIKTGAQYGYAVKKGGNPELLKLVNDTIDEAFKDGTWSNIYTKWIGSKPESTPTSESTPMTTTATTTS